MNTARPSFSCLIIGSEITQGKRQDKHLATVIEKTQQRGYAVSTCLYLADSTDRIVSALNYLQQSGDIILSFGGIGATPDDYTRQAAALAFNRPLVRHPDALALIEGRFGEEAYPNRVRMADLPTGAGLLPNPVNQIPGFHLDNRAFFMPGFPAMSWPMLDYLLEQWFPNLEAPVSRSIIAMQAREGNLIQWMENLVARYPELGFSSLPSFGNSTITEPHIEFGLTGPSALVEPAFATMCDELIKLGYTLKQKEASA